MTLIYSMEAFAQGGLFGLQSLQRDWSPYIVHFTAYSAMAKLRNWANETDCKPKFFQAELKNADSGSFSVVEKIAASGKLMANSPSEKDGIAKCVCLSECNLPGLIGHSERYGRFGFVFKKSAIFRAEGRPCCYVGTTEYEVIAKIGRGKPSDSPEGRLFSLSNHFSPDSDPKRKLQDYTHEREWRIFNDIEFATTPPDFLFAPKEYFQDMQKLFVNTPIMSLDILFQWGA